MHLPFPRSHQESIFDKFLERAVARVAKIKVANPLDPTTQMGPQASTINWRRFFLTSRSGKRRVPSA